MAKRLKRRLGRIEAASPTRLDVIIDCPCNACEKVQWSPDMPPSNINMGSGSTEVRVFDLCPGIKHDP